jgi:hypothetical protein
MTEIKHILVASDLTDRSYLASGRAIQLKRASTTTRPGERGTGRHTRDDARGGSRRAASRERPTPGRMTLGSGSLQLARASQQQGSGYP